MWKARLLETLGLLMIGDGVLASLYPARHTLLWMNGPHAWRSKMKEFAAHPNRVRIYGAAELAVGLWLASRQMPVEH